MRFVGIDLGTQSLKVVVTDERFAIVAEAARPYPTHRPSPDAAEQDPRDWERALDEAIAELGTHLAGTSAIAISGQLDGCVAVDDRGEPIGRALIWQDRRPSHVAIALDVHAITGQVDDPSHFAHKIRRLPGAARYHTPTTYLHARLTGRAVIDPALASTTLLYDLHAGTWSDALLAAYGIERATIPEVTPATATTPLARALGSIPPGTPVATGTGDDFATPLGAGIVAPGSVICAIGTAEVVGALAPSPILDRAREPMVETHAYPSGGFFVENPGWLSGGAIRWAVELLGLPDDAALDALAITVPDAAGVIFVPALAGAMTPVWRPTATATFHGLTAHHTRAHLARAVLEGLAFACRDVVDRLASLGLRTDDVIVLGGGARSQIWAQIRADVLQRTHRLATTANTCAIGAAMIAAVAAGAYPDLVAAAAQIAPPRVAIAPRHTVDEAYARYRRLVEALAPLWT